MSDFFEILVFLGSYLALELEKKKQTPTDQPYLVGSSTHKTGSPPRWGFSYNTVNV